MASLLIAATVYTYDRWHSPLPFPFPVPLHSPTSPALTPPPSVRTSRIKRRARKEDTAARYSELEKETSARLTGLQNGPSTGWEQEKGGRIPSGLGDWQDGRGVRRRGEGGSVGSVGSEGRRRRREGEGGRVWLVGGG